MVSPQNSIIQWTQHRKSVKEITWQFLMNSWMENLNFLVHFTLRRARVLNMFSQVLFFITANANVHTWSHHWTNHNIYNLVRIYRNTFGRSWKKSIYPFFLHYYMMVDTREQDTHCIILKIKIMDTNST